MKTLHDPRWEPSVVQVRVKGDLTARVTKAGDWEKGKQLENKNRRLVKWGDGCSGPCLPPCRYIVTQWIALPFRGDNRTESSPCVVCPT